MIDPKRIRQWAEASLRERGHKPDKLSHQAVAVIEAMVRGITEELANIKPTKPSESIKRQLTDAWGEAYKKRFEGKYVFQGAKDGKGADKLLATGMTNEQLMAIAKRAWEQLDDFDCKFAMSLAGYASRFNEIRIKCTSKSSRSDNGQICP